MSLITYNGESKVIKRICELLDTMTGISFVVVQILPTTDIQTNVIYLVPKTTTEVDNIYDEYINTDGTSQGWELIGTTEIDLTNYVQFSDLSTVATSGDYDDLIDKPTIPTVNDGTLTIQLNGTTEQTFTANSSSDKTANIKAVDWVSNGKLGAKNLNAYPYSETSHTERGVDWTDNGDGSFTANRTATNTNNSNFQCHTRTKGGKENLILKNGTYIFSGCPSGGSSTTYAIVISRSNPNGGGYQQLGMDTGDGITLTLDGDYYSPDEVVIGITCIIGGSYNAQNLTFKPMIRLASDTDDTWQPYSMTNQELTKKANWVDLGSQPLNTTITLTEQYSELMFQFDESTWTSNLHILRVQLSTTHLSFFDGMVRNDVEIWLDGTSIKFEWDGSSSSVCKLYAKY